MFHHSYIQIKREAVVLSALSGGAARGPGSNKFVIISIMWGVVMLGSGDGGHYRSARNNIVQEVAERWRDDQSIHTR